LSTCLAADKMDFANCVGCGLDLISLTPSFVRINPGYD